MIIKYIAMCCKSSGKAQIAWNLSLKYKLNILLNLLCISYKSFYSHFQSSKYGVSNSKWAWGAAMFDFDNNGELDIVVTNGFEVPSTSMEDFDYNGKNSLQLFQNQGLNSPMREIAEETKLTFHGMGRGILVMDYDNDGDEDVLVADNTGPPHLFKNKGGNKKNWIKVRVMHR